MPNEDFLMSEEEADKLEGSGSNPGPVSPSAPPARNAMPPYFQGSLPPTQQHDVSFVGTEVGTPRIPKTALMPLPLQSNPATNAAVQSTAIKVAASSTPNVSIKLTAPKEIVVTGSPAGPTGAFNLAWASEPAGYVFATPNEPFSAFVDTAAAIATRLPPTDLFVGVGSNGPNDWAFAFNSENNDPTPSGWTTLPGSGSANFTAWGQFLPLAGSAATYVAHIESGQAAVTSVVLFNTTGGIPVVNDFYTATVASPPFVFTNPTKAHDTIIVVLTDTPASGTDEPQGTITDSQGNTYIRIIGDSSVSWPAVLNESMAVYAAFDIVGGANTLNWSLTTTLGMYIFVVSGISAAPIIPRFIPASDVLSGSSVTSLNALTGALVLESSDSSITITPTTPNIDLTVPVMIGDTGSGGVQGLVPAPAAGDAAAGKFLKADGTWEVPAGSGSGTFGRKVVTSSPYAQIAADIGKAIDVQIGGTSIVNLAASASVPTFGASLGFQRTSGTSSTATLTGVTLTTGRVAVITVAWYNTMTDAITVTDSNGNVWTKVPNTFQLNPNTSTPFAGQQLWYAPISSGGTGITITATFPASAFFPAIYGAEADGIDVTAPIDQSTGAQGNAVPSSGSITTTATKTWVYGSVYNDSGAATGQGAGWTLIQNAFGFYLNEYQTLGTTGTLAATDNSGAAAQYTAAIVALKGTSASNLFTGWIQNNGSGNCTVNAGAGSLINGASSLVLAPGAGATFCTDNTDFTAVL